MKTKRNGVTGIAVRNLFTVMVALLLVIGFNACSNSGGGGGPSGDGGTGSKKDKNSKDWEEGGKYFNEELGRAYDVGDVNTESKGNIFYFDPDGFDLAGTGKKAYYLEAALTINFQQVVWLNPNDGAIIGTGTAIGTGKQNTALLKAAAVGKSSFVNLTLAETYEDRDEWFFPSRDEAAKLLKFLIKFVEYNKFGQSFFLWTSSEVNGSEAYSYHVSRSMESYTLDQFEKNISVYVSGQAAAPFCSVLIRAF